VTALDRIASALERIARQLELGAGEAPPAPKPRAKRKRAKPTFHPPRLVEPDELSRQRARAALRKAGL